MYKVFIIVIFLIKSILLSGQFTQINTGTSNNINSIKAVDGQIFFLGNNFLAKTIDYGANLIYLNAPNDLPNTYALNVLDTSNLYLISSNPSIYRIMNSNDGGNTWNILFDTSSTPILDLTIAQNGRILGVGTFGNVFISSNGVNWTISNTSNITVIEQCEILNDSIFVIGGFQYTGISDDTGSTWNVSMFNSSHCSQILSINTDTLYLSSYFWNGWESFFSKSFDGGFNWTTNSLGTGRGIYDIEFINSSRGYAVGYDYNDSVGIIMQTFDAGNTWETFHTSYNSEFFDSEVIEDSIMLIAGTNGTILKTCNLSIGFDKVAPSNLFEIIIYPNPTDPYSEIILSTNKPGLFHAEIFDSHGKSKKEFDFRDKLILNNISSGIYFVVITDRNLNVVSKKLIVE